MQPNATRTTIPAAHHDNGASSSCATQPRQRRLKSDPPRLYHHCSGKHYVRLPGGGSKWFSKDERTAQADYDRWTKRVWSSLQVKEGRGTGGRMRTPSDRRPSVSEFFSAEDDAPLLSGAPSYAPVPAAPTGKTVQQVAESLFALVDAESGPAGRANVRWRLKPFLERYGTRAIASLTADDLIAYKAAVVKKYKGDYRANLLTYARRLLVHAQETRAVREPFALSLLKAPPKGPPPKKGIAPERVKALLAEVAGWNAVLARMMYVQFVGCLRPSEVPKAVWGFGEDQGDGVIAVVNKTTAKTSLLRPCILLPEAVKAAEYVRTALADEPKYQTHSAYQQAVGVVGRAIGETRLLELTGKGLPLAPHFLRHSSVQAMLDQKVPAEHRAVMMGRLEAAVDRRYGERRDFSETREAAAVLAKLVPLSVLDVPLKERPKGGRPKGKRV